MRGISWCMKKFFQIFLTISFVFFKLEAYDTFKSVDVVFQPLQCEQVEKIISFINKNSDICKFCANIDDLRFVNSEIGYIQNSTGMKVIGGEREDGCLLVNVQTFEHDLNNNVKKEIFISLHNPYLALPHINLIGINETNEYFYLDEENLKGDASYQILNQQTNNYNDLFMTHKNGYAIFKFDGNVYKSTRLKEY